MASELSEPRLVAIVGPTASGKSALALEACRRFDGEIVSCDSVQVYRGLDVGSGKASADDLARVRHHLVDILDIHEEMNAAVFARRAAQSITDIIGRGRLPVVTGGTGLYLTALLKGLFVESGADSNVRARLEALAAKYGSERLHRCLVAKDPAYAARTQPLDRVRIVRALEVCYSRGQPFSEAQRERRPAFKGAALVVGLQIPREVLRERVVARVRRMLASGLIEETRRALSRVPRGGQAPRALGAIGYREVVALSLREGLEPEGDEELQRAIVTATMQYAKRQMTYFRHQFEVEWFAGEAAAIQRIAEWVAQTGSEPERDQGTPPGVPK